LNVMAIVVSRTGCCHCRMSAVRRSGALIQVKPASEISEEIFRLFQPRRARHPRPLRDAPLTHGDRSTHLADLKPYLEADQKLTALCADGDAWTHKAVLNDAKAMPKFSERCRFRKAEQMEGVPIQGSPFERGDH
jgi:hypothetical protein